MDFFSSMQNINFFLLSFLILQNILYSNAEKINSEINNATSIHKIEKDIYNYTGVENTFELLQEGEFYLDLGEHKSIVLVLGNTGSGKSTFTQFVAGDNTKLRAKEIKPDTGEYIIIDESNKIGHGIYSKTIFPERIVDPQSNTAYYDCPGFSDTRNAAFDIASTYFTKKVIDHAKSVKIVLTISYSSMRVGVDRIDFMKLIRHTNEFIKNIIKFKNSIALVVTKVDNEYIKKGTNFTLVPDKTVINKIAYYIHNVRQSLQETLDRTSDFQEKMFYKKAIMLIDIFLMKDGENYRNIALFRRPDEDGPISEIKLLQDGKIPLKKLVEYYMVFVKKSEHDFGFTISDNSKHNIFKLVEKINEEITIDISNTTQDIKNYFQYKMEDSNDLHALKNEMNFMHKFVLTSRKELENSSTFKEFLVKFIHFINDVDVKTSRHVFLNIFKKYKYLEFLQLVSNEQFKIKSAELTQPLQEVVEYSTESKIWYNFLTDLYDKLSYYKTYTKFYKDNHIILGLRQKRNANKTNLDELLLNLKEYNIKEYDNIQNMVIDNIKKHDLNNVLYATYKNNITITCPDPTTLVVKGDYVKFSKIGATHPCSNQIKSIQIFALNSLFIDADVIRTGENLNMLIIAPKWEIIGDRKIILDGASAEDTTLSKAAKGQNGRPGLPGGSAGNFIGICRKIINSEKLTITANGGSGGPGQDGGDGLPGIDGYSQLPYGDQNTGERVMQKSGFWRIPGVKKRTVAESFWEALGYAIGIYHKIETYSYRMFGSPGTRGSDGAKGGTGGNGGLAGTISLYGFDDNARISISNHNGPSGIKGKGGNGGRGGKNANEIHVEHDIKKTYWFGGKLKSTNRGWHVRKRIDRGWAMSGANNIWETTSEGIKSPRIVTFKNPSHDITDYKIYLLENLHDSVKRQGLMKFYFHLSNDSDINNAYDSFGLLNELQGFEYKFQSFISSSELEHFYKSLLKRIKEYAVSPKKYEDNKNHKKLLNYLYTVTLSKAVSIRNQSENNLIIDIDSYFNLILNDFKKLNHYANEVVKNEYNQNYKRTIDLKIREAIQFIEKQILPEIDDVNIQIERSIEQLINEIIDLQQKAYTEKDELLEKQKELRDMIEQRGIFESLKFISIVTKFFGPVGEAVSNIIQTTSKVTKSLSLDENENNKPGYLLPNGVKTLVNDGIKLFENFVNLKGGALKHLLDTILKEINKYPDKLENLSKTANDLKNNITQAEENKSLDMPQIITTTEKLLEALAKEHAELSSNNLTDSLVTDLELSDGISQMLKIFSTTVQVAELFTDTYIKHKDEDRKLQEISHAIQEQDINLNALREYQLKIYHTVFPMFVMIQHDITDYESKLGIKSRLALDISKWNIQRSFKDLKLNLGKIINGFKVQDNLARFVDKLDEAMSILISVYSRIHTYNEQKELADYIADINSVTSAAIQTENKTINDALAKLDLTMKSNIVLDQYEKAIECFKQFIFPFANYYLEEYHLSSEIEVERNLENIVANATRHIENLKTKLNQHNVSLHRNFDQYVYEEHFQSGDTFNGPFIVWNNERFENSISKLLSGDEVILKANILNSFHEKNAIKFNKIQLQFKPRDTSINNILNEKLKFFDITMKHYGNSYYRCDNSFYLLTSDSQTFYYSFEKDKNDEPVRKNRVYTKIKNGQYMLSPYATWSFQLKGVLNSSFIELSALKGLVDLELVGHGQFVSAENNICGRDLKKYYKTSDAISVTDIFDLVDAS